MADEENIRRLVSTFVRDEMSRRTSMNQPSNIYERTQSMIRQASQSVSNNPSSNGASVEGAGAAVSDCATASSAGAGSHSIATLPNRGSSAIDNNNNNIPSPSIVSTRYQSPNFFNKRKRGKNPTHPYRLPPVAKKQNYSKEKAKVIELVMLDENEDAHNSVRVEDSAIVGSWWYDLVPNKTEEEIKTELCNMFKSKLPLTTEGFNGPIKKIVL